MSTPNSYKNFIAATADIAFLDTLGNSAEFTKDELEANLEEHAIADPTAGQRDTTARAAASRQTVGLHANRLVLYPL